MKGLIFKDLLNTKSQLKTIGIIILAFAAFSIPQGNVGFIIGYTVLLATMLVITSISYDHMANWDKYALTMPISRAQIVLSKYILMIITSVIGVVLSIVLTLILNIFIKKIDIGETLLSSFMVVSVALIFGSIILPLIYKFGPEKARILIILCALLPTAITLLISQILKSTGMTMPDENFLNSLLYFVPVISVILFIISFFISLSIYRKKEF